MDAVRLWHIVREDVWEQHQRAGVIRADGRRAGRFFQGARPAYRWMMGQMRRRLAGYGGRYPVWAWAAPKPDLRSTFYLSAGTRGVRLECLVPAAAVLLSDFRAWCGVLSQDYIELTEEEFDDRERREHEALDAAVRELPEDQQAAARFRWAGSGGFAKLPPDLQREARTSWERVFDLEAIYASDNWYGGKWTGGRYAGTRGPQMVQAVLEEIRLDQVVAVTPFVGRRSWTD